MKRALLIIGLLTILAPTLHAATIIGTTYDGLSLETLPNTIVTLNTSPEQTVLVKDGTYSFNVPVGNYTIKGTYLEQGIVVLEATQLLEVKGEGTYTVDLILLPDVGDVPDDPLPDDEPPPSWTEQLWQGPGPWLILLAIVMGGIVYAVMDARRNTRARYQKTSSEETNGTEEAKEPPALDQGFTLDGYALEVLHDLKRGGNRLTQKELRSMINIGEAKVSLVVSEMESYGLIKKIKKGRGNILILTEKGREELERRKTEEKNIPPETKPDQESE
ncbi:MAG: hypothetical protein AABW68_05200 [archaeon]